MRVPFLFFFGVSTSQVFGANFQVVWDFRTKPTLAVQVADVIEFTWSNNFLDVHQNPSLSCDQEGSIPLYSPATLEGSYSYTVQEEDAGGKIAFASSVGTRCEDGAFLLVNVLVASSMPTSTPTPFLTQTRSETPSLTPSQTLTQTPTQTTTHTPTHIPTESMPPSTSALPTELEFVEYLDSPELKWSIQLFNTGASTGAAIGPGNGVTVSPDGSLVYVTLDNGRLDVLSSSSGTSRYSYSPPSLAPGWVTSCKSGVTFSELSGVKYAIYAIIDVPPIGVSEDVQSRIVSLSHPDNKVLWVSDVIPGEVQGRPQVTERKPGEYIVFTHNQLNMTTGELYGSVSMILADSGMLAWTENAGDSSIDPNLDDLQLIDDLRLPYGPIGVAHFPEEGRYPGGEGNNNDIFVWATSDNDGLGPSGYTRAFQIPRLFEPAFAPSLRTTFLKDNRWNTVTSPTLSRDGMNLYFGIRQHRIRGWTGGQDFDQLANMVIDEFPENPIVPRTPIPFSPVLSASEQKMFIGLTLPFLYAVESQTGTVEWELVGNSTVSGPVSTSPDDMLICLTWVDGTVMAISQDTGIPEWSIQCKDIDPDSTTLCKDDIPGASSLSPNGLVYFYGDRTGNVKALQVGFSLLNTTAPSAFPTQEATVAPTRSPSLRPTVVATEKPSATPTRFPTMVTTVPTNVETTTAPTNGETPVPTTPAPMDGPSTLPVAFSGETGSPVSVPGNPTITWPDSGSSSFHYYTAMQSVGVVLISLWLIVAA